MYYYINRKSEPSDCRLGVGSSSEPYSTIAASSLATGMKKRLLPYKAKPLFRSGGSRNTAHSLPLSSAGARV